MPRQIATTAPSLSKCRSLKSHSFLFFISIPGSFFSSVHVQWLITLDTVIVFRHLHFLCHVTWPVVYSTSIASADRGPDERRARRHVSRTDPSGSAKNRRPPQDTAGCCWKLQDSKPNTAGWSNKVQTGQCNDRRMPQVTFRCYIEEYWGSETN